MCPVDKQESVCAFQPSPASGLLRKVHLTKFPRYNAHHATHLEACSVGCPRTESIPDVPSISICRHPFSSHSRSHNPDRRTTSHTTGTGRNQVRFSSSSL